MSALSKQIAPIEPPPTAAPEKGGGAPAAKTGRLLEVDGYRGLAAVTIILVHAWQQGGFPYIRTPLSAVFGGFDLAVALFFALSGYVTYLPIVRGGLTGKTPSGRAFMVRRLYRILPLYFVLIVVVWAARYDGSGVEIWDLVRHLTFTQVYDKQQIFWIIGPAWSLADEVHYYLVIALLGPPLALLATRAGSVRRRLLVMASLPAALLIASVGYTTYVAYGLHISWYDSWVYYNPIARVDTFAMGMLLAIVLSVPGLLGERPRLATVLSTVGSAIVVAHVLLRHLIEPLATYNFTIGGIGCLMLLAGASLLAPHQLLSRFLRARVVQLWATIGLSIYLLHEPIMLQLDRWHVLYFIDPVAWPISAAGLVAATTLVGWLTHRWIEQPGVQLQGVIAELRTRQRRAAARRSGPPPRWLPDLVLRTADGAPVPLRELPRDRPVLFAFDHDGGRSLTEQRFRLLAGEADGFYVTGTSDETGPEGTSVLVDADRRLELALGGAAGLVEVSPAGLITAVHRPSVTHPPRRLLRVPAGVRHPYGNDPRACRPPLLPPASPRRSAIAEE